MTELKLEQAQALRAAIYEMSPAAQRQALLAALDLLVKRPSILTIQFVEIIDDARKYNRAINER